MEPLGLSPCQGRLECARFRRSHSAKPCVSTEKTGRQTGRREAEPPEAAQITETVVPFWPWKWRAMAWASSAGIKRSFLTGFPRRPMGVVMRSWPEALMPTASQKPKGYGIDVEHQEADLAAGSGGACPEQSPRGRRGTPRPRPAVAEAARTASHREVRHANTAARPDPCRLWRSGHAGRGHAASMARPAAAVW
jgi:hypothetical protein